MVFRNQQETGSFGRGGQRPVSLRLEFTGRLGPDFTVFALARAERLGLRGWIVGRRDRAIVHLEGPEALAGAFEVACCIGPDTVVVDDWSCADEAPDRQINGFHVRDILKNIGDAR